MALGHNMKWANKLFLTKKKDIYDTDKSDAVFVKAMKENCLFEYSHNPDYKRILDEAHFDPKSINSYSDLASIPFLPTLYFKHHEMLSVPKRRCLVKATSSGTSGHNVSLIGLSFSDLWRGWEMIRRVFSYHHVWSSKPTHFLIFGYEPNRHNKRAIAKTAHGFSFTSPGITKDYAIRYKNDHYEVDLDNIEKKLIKYSKGHLPIRTLGFPAYTYFLLEKMKSEGIKLTLPKGSLLTLGGGWKQFYKEKVNKQDFYDLAYDVLGISDNQIVEFFGAVEHPILYTDCRCHHFHIPSYARVIIRDVDTLKPIPNGQVGLINLLTPMVKATPVLSVVTDDLGILHEEKCPCGEKGYWLEILGRSGLDDIKTCAAGAEEILKGGKEK